MYQGLTCRQSNFSSLTSLMYWTISNVTRPSGNNRRVHSLWLKKTIKVRNFYAVLMVGWQCVEVITHTLFTPVNSVTEEVLKQLLAWKVALIISLILSCAGFIHFPEASGVRRKSKNDCFTDMIECNATTVTAIQQNWWLDKRLQGIMILKT